MRITLSDAIRYPFTSERLMSMVVMPGIMAYVDLIVTIILVVILVVVIVAIVVAVGFSAGKEMTQALHTVSPLLACLAVEAQHWVPSALWPQSPHFSVGNTPMEPIQAGLLKLKSSVSGLLHQVGDVFSSWNLDASAESWGGDGGDAGDSSSSNPFAGGGGGGGGGGNAGTGPVFTTYWFGLNWELFARWKREGIHAEPPAAMNETYFTQGIKGLAYYGPVNILIAILVLCVFALLIVGGMSADVTAAFAAGQEKEALKALFTGTFLVLFVGFVVALIVGNFFLSPFLIAPMVVSCEERTVAKLWDMSAALEATAPYYGRILVNFLKIGLLALAYFLVSIPIICTCVGILALPFLWCGPFRVSSALLLADGFGLFDPHQEALEVNDLMDKLAEP